MTTDANWTELQQAEDMASFRADLCLSSPESYSLEEKRGICNEMMDMSKAILDAMRADFQGYPPEFRSKLLALICETEPKKAGWWWDVLVGKDARCIGSPKLSNAKAVPLTGTQWDSMGYYAIVE